MDGDGQCPKTIVVLARPGTRLSGTLARRRKRGRAERLLAETIGSDGETLYAAGLGTVCFGLFTTVGDYRLALLCAGFLLLPAAGIAWR